MVSSPPSKYLADNVQLLADSGRRLLRSANYRTCVVPQHSFGDRDSSVAGPRIWNDLPPELRHVDISFGQLRNMLQSYLFRSKSATAHRDFLLLRLRSSLTYLLTTATITILLGQSVLFTTLYHSHHDHHVV